MIDNHITVIKDLCSDVLMELNLDATLMRRGDAIILLFPVGLGSNLSHLSIYQRYTTSCGRCDRCTRDLINKSGLMIAYTSFITTIVDQTKCKLCSDFSISSQCFSVAHFVMWIEENRLNYNQTDYINHVAWLIAVIYKRINSFNEGFLSGYIQLAKKLFSLVKPDFPWEFIL